MGSLQRSGIKIEVPKVLDVVCAIPATALFLLLSWRVLPLLLGSSDLSSVESSSTTLERFLVHLALSFLTGFAFAATGALWLLVLTPTWVMNLRGPAREWILLLVTFGSVMSVGVCYSNLADIMSSFLIGYPPTEDAPRQGLLATAAVAPLGIVTRLYFKWSWTKFLGWVLFAATGYVLLRSICYWGLRGL